MTFKERSDLLFLANKIEASRFSHATSVQRQISGKGFGFYAIFNTPGYNLEKTFEELSKKDFELSLTNAKSLDDKYFRTLAVIAVAGNCAKNAKPATKVNLK